MKRRLLALLLTFVMIVGMIPTSVFADEAAQETEAAPVVETEAPVIETEAPVIETQPPVTEAQRLSSRQRLPSLRHSRR